jgi:hypothetical protein
MNYNLTSALAKKMRYVQLFIILDFGLKLSYLFKKL